MSSVFSPVISKPCAQPCPTGTLGNCTLSNPTAHSTMGSSLLFVTTTCKVSRLPAVT